MTSKPKTLLERYKSVFTSEDSVDGGVRGQARLPSFMEDPSVGQVLRQEEPPAGEHVKSHKTKLKNKNNRPTNLHE